MPKYWICKTRSSARIAILPLEIAVQSGFCVHQWAENQGRKVEIIERYTINFASIDVDEFDYFIVFAGSGEGSAADRLRLALQSNLTGALLSIVNFSKADWLMPRGWDALFACPSGRWDDPLSLFLATRLVGFGDNELFDLFKGRTIVIHPAAFNDYARPELREMFNVQIMHFSIASDGQGPWSAFTLVEAENAFKHCQSLSPQQPILFSVGIGCLATSPIQFFCVSRVGSQNLEHR